VTRPGAAGLADDLARFERQAAALADDYRQLLARVRDLCGGHAVRRCQQAVAPLVTMSESQAEIGRLLREAVAAVVSEAAGAAAGDGGHDDPA
jgi:hypothetical protein